MMNKGKTVCSQLISVLPEKTFAEYVEKYKGDFGVKRFKCREHFIVMSSHNDRYSTNFHRKPTGYRIVPDGIFPKAVLLWSK